jgi:hypothetical protein
MHLMRSRLVDQLEHTARPIMQESFLVSVHGLRTKYPAQAAL